MAHGYLTSATSTLKF